MLVMADFVSRLYGVRSEADGLEWNCRLPDDAERSHYHLPTALGKAELSVSRTGADLRLAGRDVLNVRGTARVLTDGKGHARSVIGTAPEPAEDDAHLAGRRFRHAVRRPRRRGPHPLTPHQTHDWRDA